MLRQRVITAIVLLLVLAASLWVDAAWPFLGLLAVACGCAAWEWLRLTMPADKGVWAIAGGIAVFVVCAALITNWTGPDDSLGRGPSVWWINSLIYGVALVWVAGAIPAVVRGQAQGPGDSVGWSIFGVLALLAAWIALALMYLMFSAWFVVSLLITVWVADIAAYFVGRAIGKRKLAPRVSPGKTIAGAVAGVAGSVLWIIASGLAWDNTFGAALIQYWTLPGAFVIAALIGAISIVGDLFESLLKRRAGRKDSSGLLPGHGGVYDRVDAILPVAVCAHTVLVIGAMQGLA